MAKPLISWFSLFPTSSFTIADFWVVTDVIFFPKGIGEVVLTGEKCKNFHQGQAVGYFQFGTFSEYMVKFLFDFFLDISRNV